MEFYFDMTIRWGALMIFSFVCLIETKEELMIVVKKRMVLILLLIFYAGICTVISIIFPIKPFLVRYTIDELKITEGYCYVTYGARLSHINIGLSPLDFDVSLWISEYKRQIEKKSSFIKLSEIQNDKNIIDKKMLDKSKNKSTKSLKKKEKEIVNPLLKSLQNKNNILSIDKIEGNTPKKIYVKTEKETISSMKNNNLDRKSVV